MLDNIEGIIEVSGVEYYKIKDSCVLVGCSDFNKGLVEELRHCYSRMEDALMEIGDNQKVRYILQETITNRK